MAVKTTWTVHHSCGHEQTHDLAHRRPSKRAGYARWLERNECSHCWQASRDPARDTESERWRAKRRADEKATIETWEQTAAMPALDGTERAVGWGRQVRHTLMCAAFRHAQACGVADGDFAEQVETPARQITSATWWIDQRDAPADDVAELVIDAATIPAAGTATGGAY